jgi:hypothetical protein
VNDKKSHDDETSEQPKELGVALTTEGAVAKFGCAGGKGTTDEAVCLLAVGFVWLLSKRRPDPWLMEGQCYDLPTTSERHTPNDMSDYGRTTDW